MVFHIKVIKIKIISWNVNGIRAVAKKGFDQFLLEYNPDVLCVQETKAQEDQLDNSIKKIGKYHSYFHSAKKKGYSSVAIYSKEKPISVIKGIGIEEFDDEGRVLTAEYEDFFVLSIYVPNAQPELARIEYRKRFNDALLDFVDELQLEYGKDVLLCGDLNVAHNEIDLKNPGPNKNNPGFSDEEREKFNELLAAGYVDSFRHLHPEEIKYSWWSYRFSARDRNIGWRIDYIVVNEEMIEQVEKAEILNEVMGSDHCPVSITLKKKNINYLKTGQ